MVLDERLRGYCVLMADDYVLGKQSELLLNTGAGLYGITISQERFYLGVSPPQPPEGGDGI